MVWDGLGVSIGGSLKEQVGQTALQESCSGINFTNSPEVPSSAGLSEFIDIEPELGRDSKVALGHKS